MNRLLAATALTGAAFALPQFAAAQSLPAEASANETGDRSDEPVDQSATVAGDDVVVTGSRIQRPNLESTAPITSVNVGQLTQTGNLSIGDALIRLPQIRGTFSQSNSTRFIGTAGLSLLDLRGLGTNRTLVLVNGRRHITSQPGVPTSVDINTIPTDLIQRVDVQTGGSSAVYGADAVAGVVNFVLRRDFEGLTARAQGGTSERGDRGSYFVSITGGKNFAEGRGNVAFNAEYAFSDDLYFRQRDDVYGAYRGRDQFQAVENTIGEPAAGNGVFDTQFTRNVRNIGISEGGIYQAVCPTTAAAGETAAQLAARRAVVCNGLNNQTGQPLGFTFAFTPDGRLVRNDVERDFRPFGSANSVGGLGSTLRLTGQLAPQLERKAFNLLGSFEVTPAFRPFFEAKYVRIDAIQEGQPTFGTYTFSVNNPFLDAASRNLAISTLAPGVTTFQTTRFNVDFGGRGEDHRRETYRIVAGVDGGFNEDWRYELAFNYGRLETQYATQGNILSGGSAVDPNSRFGRSLNAVRNAAGQIVCGVNADTNPANDDPACVPVNLFGNGQVSQAALNYFGFTSTREQEAEQYNVTGFVSGDLSQLFELPGGPIAFSVGGEYRRETAFSAFDETTRSGATFLNAIPIFDPPALETQEVFGELRIPVVKDRPYFHELSFEGAARYTDINIGDIGGIFTYNVGGFYAPVDGLRIRGSYARSIRAPTQSDLFAAPSQTFLNTLVDPCSQTNINNGPNRRANCAAAGVPVNETVGGVSVPFTNVIASGIRGLNGSNELLQEEKSTSWSFGLVLQPRAVPGLSFSIDYYNIEIENVIFSLGAQTIIDQCYDSPSGIDNQYCAAVFRRADGTFQGQFNRNVGGQTITYPVAPADRSFISGPFNFASQVTTGVDANLSYTRTIGPVKADFNGILAYVARRDNFTDINRPSFINQQLFEVGDPRWRGTINLNLDFGAFDFAYNFRYIGKQVTSNANNDEFEQQNSVQGRAPTNADIRPDVFFKPVMYSDLQFGVNTNDDKFRFYVGVDNVFDRFPPVGLTGTGTGEGLFDTVGRFFYAGARVNF
jgi:outer membrane receptor protein involved in Fe transport